MESTQPPEGATLKSYVLASLGLVAAFALLGVSALMNLRFAASLGHTATDGAIYGVAAVAADCFKALAPFFFFAAIRNRMWSQAIAAFAVWLTVTTFALVGATGHAALNRTDVTGQREVASAQYKDLRADAKRVSDQLSWIPQHRPAATVLAEIASMKTQRTWAATAGCTDATSKVGRDFCSTYHKLNAEHASAVEGGRLQARLDEISQKLAPIASAPKDGDPQASVLSRLTGIDIGTMTGMLVLLIVLLLEVGSGLGPYVAMSHFPDRPARKRTDQAQDENDEVEHGPSTDQNVVQFPNRSPVSEQLGGVSTMETPKTDASLAFPYSEGEAKEDLKELIAQHGAIPSQQHLAARWGVTKGTVSKWLDKWEGVHRTRVGKRNEVTEASTKIAA